MHNGGTRDVRYLAGPAIVIGREEGDIVYPDDEFLSRRHAQLAPGAKGCIVEDLRSSNGTFLRLAARTRLSHKDCLRIGEHLFRFEVGSG